jgi:hypothetical protein
MGVTIHWQGRLAGPINYDRIVHAIRTFAVARRWPIKEIERAERRLERVIAEREVPYIGPTFGLTVWPHADCEPVRFEFDEAFFTQEYCKTQFAGVATHIAVIDLLRRVAPLFCEFEVVDEGDYWESSDEARLKAHIDQTNKVIDEIKAEHPNAKSQVVMPSGRIVDVYQ